MLMICKDSETSEFISNYKNDFKVAWGDQNAGDNFETEYAGNEPAVV